MLGADDPVVLETERELADRRRRDSHLRASEALKSRRGSRPRLVGSRIQIAGPDTGAETEEEKGCDEGLVGSFYGLGNFEGSHEPTREEVDAKGAQELLSLARKMEWDELERCLATYPSSSFVGDEVSGMTALHWLGRQGA